MLKFIACMCSRTTTFQIFGEIFFTKFSTHSPYENVSREQRFCKPCNTGEVENEYHLALSCPKYQELRNNSNTILKNLFYLKEGKQKLFEHAMYSDDPVLVKLISISISFSAFWREILASNPWKIRGNN